MQIWYPRERSSLGVGYLVSSLMGWPRITCTIHSPGTGGDRPGETDGEEIETLVDDKEGTCYSAAETTLYLTQNDEGSSLTQGPSFMLGAVRRNALADSRRGDFLSSIHEGVTVPYRSFPGKLTLRDRLDILRQIGRD